MSRWPSSEVAARNVTALIELKAVADRVGGLDLVLIGADDPEAMLRHTEECRSRSIPFAADFSQQIARMDGDEIRTLLDGATYLFSNEYEKGLIESKTGWTEQEILSRVGHRITTLGSRGVRIERVGEPAIEVGCPEETAKVDPTGVGDAFRGGLMKGLAQGRSLTESAQLGSVAATWALEHLGGQSHAYTWPEFVRRYERHYGPLTEASPGGRGWGLGARG